MLTFYTNEQKCWLLKGLTFKFQTFDFQKIMLWKNQACIPNRLYSSDTCTMNTQAKLILAPDPKCNTITLFDKDATVFWHEDAASWINSIVVHRTASLPSKATKHIQWHCLKKVDVYMFSAWIHYHTRWNATYMKFKNFFFLRKF